MKTTTKISAMKKEVIQAVAGQICNMIENNIIEEHGSEHFEDWCENGEAFDDGEHDEAFIEECMKLVKDVSPLINKLTYEYLNFEKFQL